MVSKPKSYRLGRSQSNNIKMGLKTGCEVVDIYKQF